MLVIRAPAICGACRQVAAQGTNAQGDHRCVSCAFVGGEGVRDNNVHTNGIVTALVGPRRKNSVGEARWKLFLEVGPKNRDEYNRYAQQLVDAIRTTGGARTSQPMVRFAVNPWQVNANTLATHGNHLFELWQGMATPEEKRAFVDKAAGTLVPALTAVRGPGTTYDSRGLLAEVLGPFEGGAPFGARTPLGLFRIMEAIHADMVGEAGAFVGPVQPCGNECSNMDDAAAEALRTSLCTMFTAGERTMTLQQLSAWLPGMLHTSGMAAQVHKNASFAAFLLQRNYAAASNPEALQTQINWMAAAESILYLVLEQFSDETVMQCVLTVAVDCLGENRMFGSRTAGAIQLATFFSVVANASNPALVSSELVDWDESDPIGAEVLEHVDASLLRRAKEAVKKRTADKQYSTLVLEKELRKLWGSKMEGHGKREEWLDYARTRVADTVANQPAVTDFPRGFRNFVLVAGNEFYRDGKPTPAPPAKVQMTQNEFVGKNRGEPNWQVIADQLVNMSEYFNRRELQKMNIPPARVELLGPTGVKSVRKTAKQQEVVNDLQKMRRSLISDLQQVAATEYGKKGQEGGTYPAREEVDDALSRMFQGLWEQVPNNVKDGAAVETFPSIMQQYQREKGTPVQRRGNMITRFLSRRK